MITDHALAILGTLGTVLFGVLSVYFYVRSRRFRRLDLVWTAITLQSRRHEDVRILFKDREIDDLSRLRILIINSGTEPVRGGSDFPSHRTGAVTIQKDGAKTTFLSVACLFGDLSTSQCAAAIDGAGDARVTFEYLNADQRVGIEILFTGAVPQFRAELIGGALRLRQGLDTPWTDGIAELLQTFLIVPPVFAILTLAWIPSFRTVEQPYRAILAILTFVGTLAVEIAIVRALARSWRRRRHVRDERRGRYFLLGLEPPKLHAASRQS